MDHEDEQTEVRRERLLLAGTVALALIAPAVVWKFGRMSGEADEDSSGAADLEPRPTRTPRPRTQATARVSRLAEATPRAMRTPKAGAGAASRPEGRAPVTPMAMPEASPTEERVKGRGRKARGEGGTPAGQP